MLAQDETNQLLAEILAELKDIKSLMENPAGEIVYTVTSEAYENIKVGGTD